MRNTFTCISATILAQFWATTGFADPPRVAKAVPNNGDVNVDPNLKEIRITFNQPMARGMSPVAGGATDPQSGERPRWVTSRTIAIPAMLEPNHDYWISANSERFRNFTNRRGEPAVPYPIRFRTGSGKGDDSNSRTGAAADGDTPSPERKENRRAVNLLRSAIRNHYSHRDRLNIDWDELLRVHEERLASAVTPTEFARIAGTVLARAQDKHIWLRVGNETIPSYVRPSVPNANYSLLPELVPGLRKHGRAVVSGRWDDGIGYLAIATWNPRMLDEGKLVLEALRQLRDTRALIIDVRANGGGDERLAQQLAGCFVDQRQLYSKHVYRDPNSHSGFTAPNERWIEPNTDWPRYDGGVAVLSGPAVMSSCESFLLMMKCIPDAVIVGEASQGSSGNPKPHDLRNGVTVYLPSWKDLTPDGKELEGSGISADIEIATLPKDFESSDPVLAAALDHLRTPSRGGMDGKSSRPSPKD